MKKAMLVVVCTVFLVGLADMGHAFLFFGGGGGGKKGGGSGPGVDSSVFQFNFDSLKTKSLMTGTSISTWVTGTMGTGDTNLEVAVG